MWTILFYVITIIIIIITILSRRVVLWNTFWRRRRHGDDEKYIYFLINTYMSASGSRKTYADILNMRERGDNTSIYVGFKARADVKLYKGGE